MTTAKFRKELVRNRAACQLQRGQSVAEFLAMLAVLVPMFLMVGYMGRLSDMKQTSIQASRYAAWERTVADHSDKQESQLGMEVKRRFFGPADTHIKTNEVTSDADGYRNQLWRDQGGNWMVARSTDTNSYTQNNAVTGSAARPVNAMMDTFLTGLSRLDSSAKFDANTKGLYYGQVSTNVASNKVEGLDSGMDCRNAKSTTYFACLRQHNVILADTWSSSSPGQVEERVRGMVPMSMFSGLAKVGDFVGNFFLLKEWSRFEPGYVAPDVIPADRLGRYEGY